MQKSRSLPPHDQKAHKTTTQITFLLINHIFTRVIASLTSREMWWVWFSITRTSSSDTRVLSDTDYAETDNKSDSYPTWFSRDQSKLNVESERTKSENRGTLPRTDDVTRCHVWCWVARFTPADYNDVELLQIIWK